MSFQKKQAQISKYRNAIGKQAKKEDCFGDLSICSSSSPSECSNAISTSKKWISYKHGSLGGNAIGIISLHHRGRLSKSGPFFNAHSAPVVDFEFSPFDDDLFASGGEDSLVKVWSVPSDFKHSERSCFEMQSAHTFSIGTTKRIEIVKFHPTANNVLFAASYDTIRIFDIGAGMEKIKMDGVLDTPFHSMSWKNDGSLLVTSSKDNLLRIWDPRNSSSPTSETKCHEGTKSSCVVWVGDKHQIFSTGFSSSHQKEWAIHDTRNLSQPLLRTSLDSSSAILMPLFDSDTNTMYVLGKGETTIKWMELNDSSPWVSEGTPFMVGAPVSGYAMVPKLCLRVMEGEVSRLLCVCGDTIVPVSFNVPRKSYRDFHEDLYPYTKGNVPGLSSDEWFSGDTRAVETVSLDPASGNLVHSLYHGDTIKSALNEKFQSLSIDKKPELGEKEVKVSPEAAKPQPENNLGYKSESPGRRDSVTPSPSTNHSRRESAIANLRTSSYRYISAKPLHAREHYEDLRNLSYALSGESNVLEANSKFLAFPISGTGGRIGIAKVGSPGRLPPIIPSFIAGSEILDFTLSSIHPNLMVTASEDGKLRGWNIPEEGISADVATPEFSLSGHYNRVNIVQFHPFVDNVLVSSSIEQVATSGQAPTIRLWDVSTQKEMRKYEVMKDVLFGMAFNTSGNGLLATSCKDRQIRLLDARNGSTAMECIGHEGARGSRVTWAQEHLLTTGFGKGSQREVNLYDLRSFERPLYSLSLDISPSIIVPHFDEDTNLVYLCGRGDTGIMPVEVAPSLSQALFPVARFDSPNASIQQGVVFMPKTKVDTRGIEVARCWRLTQTSIEPISFSVTRSRKEYFQDDIYPLARAFDVPTMNAGEWFGGAQEIVPQREIDLCPKDMIKLSAAPAEIKTGPKYQLDNGPRRLSENERQAKFMTEIFDNAQADAEDGPLKQDLMEGVAEEEWDD